jgi:hypothetical protein
MTEAPDSTRVLETFWRRRPIETAAGKPTVCKASDPYLQGTQGSRAREPRHVGPLMRPFSTTSITNAKIAGFVYAALGSDNVSGQEFGQAFVHSTRLTADGAEDRPHRQRHWPDARGTVPTGGDNARSIRVEGSARKMARVTVEHNGLPSAVRAPDARGAILATGENARAIRTERDAADSLGVPSEHNRLTGAVDTPDARSIILTAGDNSLSIPTETGGHHAACIATKCYAVAHAIRAPDAHSTVVTARKDVNIIRAKNGAPDDGIMAAKDEKLTSVVSGPYASGRVSAGRDYSPAIGAERSVKHRSGEFAPAIAVTAQDKRRAEPVGSPDVSSTVHCDHHACAVGSKRGAADRIPVRTQNDRITYPISAPDARGTVHARGNNELGVCAERGAANNVRVAAENNRLARLRMTRTVGVPEDRRNEQR